MACIKFNIDKLANKLGNMAASALDEVSSQLGKVTQIADTLASAAEDIGNLAANAVENFKKIASGELPSLEDIKNKVFSEIDSAVSAVLDEFENTLDALGEELQNLENFISEQLDCMNDAKTKMAEVASIQGGLTNNISKNVGKLTNNQIRDMQLQTDLVDGKKLQEQLSQSFAKTAIAAQQLKAEKGKSFSQQAKTQEDIVDNFDVLTKSFNDENQFAHFNKIPEVLSDSEFESKFGKTPQLFDEIDMSGFDPDNANFAALVDPDTTEVVGWIDEVSGKTFDELPS